MIALRYAKIIHSRKHIQATQRQITARRELPVVIHTPVSHRRRGATAVPVRHKPQWHRHDRRGSAVVPTLIAVAPRKTVKIAELRGGRADTLNMFKTSAVPPRVGPIRSGIAAAPPLPQRHRHGRRGTVQGPHHRRAFAVQPPCNRENPTGDLTAIPWRFYCGYGGATTSMAPQCCRQHRSHAANDRRRTAIKPQL